MYVSILMHSMSIIISVSTSVHHLHLCRIGEVATSLVTPHENVHHLTFIQFAYISLSMSLSVLVASAITVCFGQWPLFKLLILSRYIRAHCTVAEKGHSKPVGPSCPNLTFLILSFPNWTFNMRACIRMRGKSTTDRRFDACHMTSRVSI